MARLLGASFLVFLTLLSLLFGVGILVLTRSHVPPGFVAPLGGLFALTIVLLQFLLGPMIIDLVTRIRWADPRELGTDFDLWLKRTCATFKIPTPRFGIIEEDSPNAFTYGHAAYDARVVITRGVINALTPEELKAVVAHELGHVKNRDFIVMTAVQALVLGMYAIYTTARWSRRHNAWYVVTISQIAYWISYYASLYLSRIREYMADYASAQITGRPNELSTALVKIAYGLAQAGMPAPNPYLTGGAPLPMPNNPYQPKPIPPLRPVPTGAYAQPVQRRRRSEPIQSIRLDDPSTWPSAAPQPQVAASQASPVPSVNPFIAAMNTPNPAPMSPSHGLLGMGSHPAADPTRPPKGVEGIGRAIGAFGVMGIGNIRAAIAWTGPTGLASQDNFLEAARWELYNPWAKVAELYGTHPLIARRIMALQKLNRLFNQPNAYDFSKIKPAKYHGLLGDLISCAVPFLGGSLVSGIVALFSVHKPTFAFDALLAFGIGYVLGLIGQLLWKYPSKFASSQVLRMLGEMEVSHIRCKPVVLEGTFVGRLKPGISWASDFVFQDSTGFISCYYRSAAGLMKLFFGIFMAKSYVGRRVRVYGWYRRFHSPFVEISHFEMMDSGEVVQPRYVLTLTVMYLLFVTLMGSMLYFDLVRH